MKTIKDLEDYIVSECTIVDRETAFAESLDSDGPIDVRGLSMMPSDIWKEMDPTAFRCGVNDYADGEPWTEVQGETYDNEDIGNALESFLDPIRDELNRALDELERLEMESEDEPDSKVGTFEEIDAKNAEISTLSAFISECERHAF